MRAVAALEVPDAADRDDLASFVGRAVALDGSVVVRLRSAAGRIELFAGTPFDALLTRAAVGRTTPTDLTVPGSELLAALAVAGGPSVDPGTVVDERWRGPVPAGTAWEAAGVVPAGEVDAVATRGIAAAQDTGRASAALLDETALVVGGLSVPMRCVLALSGAGLLDAGVDLTVSGGGGWVRVDASAGSVVRRRLAQLPLAVS